MGIKEGKTIVNMDRILGKVWRSQDSLPGLAGHQQHDFKSDLIGTVSSSVKWGFWTEHLERLCPKGHFQQQQKMHHTLLILRKRKGETATEAIYMKRSRLGEDHCKLAGLLL